MFQITRDQISLFERAQWQRFENEVIARLRQNFEPVLRAFQLDDVKLRDVIHLGVQRAEKYNILSEYDVTRFIEYIFEYGGHFESLPWVQTVFDAQDLTGGEKMDRLDAFSAFILR